jgi:hypothetical protein
MSGFDTGTSQGLVSTSKQLGSILRGHGAPVPQAGVLGDIYIDVDTWQLFEKRQSEGLDPWGHYLFVVPETYQSTLNFFGTTIPPNDLGNVGDYYLQYRGYANYGINPAIYGPKQASGWPENGSGPDTVIADGTGSTVLPVGLLDEGATLLDKQPAQLIVVGLLAEYVNPLPVTADDGEAVLQVGLQSSGVQVTVTPNTLYTVEDEHAVT